MENGLLFMSMAHRRVMACIIAAIWCSGMNPQSAQGQDDAFVQQRDFEAEKNASSGFSIAFADDRRAFHPGETIKLVFTFRRADISPFNYEHCHGMGIADAVLDHVDGTADPQADLWNNGITRLECGILSGVIGGVVGSKDLPRIEFPVYLNQAVRFDHPGKYRFYVRSRHRFLRSPGDKAPPLISNILELEILPRDRDWERTTIAKELDVLRASSNVAARALAARSISYLGTTAAVDEMVRTFSRTPPLEDNPGDRGDWDFHWLRGLYGSPERAYVVTRMQQELDRPNRHISPAFVSHLALLDLTRRSQTRPVERSDYDTGVLSQSTRHLAALQPAGTLRKYFEKAFALTAEHDWPIGTYALAPGFVKFPADVEAAFATLPPTRQRTFLNSKRNWTVLRNSAFIPMLRRLAVARVRSGPQDIAFRLLYDLSPLEGRQIGLRELAKPGSTISISGLAVLPDQRLPNLENAFVRVVEQAKTDDEYARAIDRIERFATVRIVTRVRRAYERFRGSRTCALAPAALAYFFRVAPAYAREEIDNVMREVYEGGRCEDGVLPAIAERRTVDALEDVAIDHLDHVNGWMVADAAEMLKQHGSPRAEASLWRALERWHERWKDRASTLEAHQQDPDGMPWEEAIERDLVTALMNGTSWVMSQASAQRLTALCLTPACKRQVEQEFSYPASNPNIRIHPSTMPGGEPSFVVRANTLVAFSSRNALYRWVSLHPKGTTFAWQDSGWFDYDDVWLPGEVTGLFEETRLFLESRGMKVIRRH
jgi:hypothetical protein